MSATVVTFYSFKGGVGRTQALANVAVGLANRGKHVVVVDMDLESPGLHAFFYPDRESREPFKDDNLAAAPGFMDFLEQCSHLPEEEPKILDLLLPCTHPSHRPGTGSIHLMPAGRLTGDYPARIGTFSWDTFYKEKDGYSFLELFRDRLVNASGADYVLVDSRTGMTDVANICTFQLPDVVVVLFGLHEQGIEGAYRVAQAIRRAQEAEREEARPKRVLLVPSRVEETGELASRNYWLKHVRERLGNSGELLADHGQRIPYLPQFAYGEQVVIDPQEPDILSEAYNGLLERLTGTSSRDTNRPAPLRMSFDEIRQDLQRIEGDVAGLINSIEACTPKTMTMSEIQRWAQGLSSRRDEHMEEVRRLEEKLRVISSELGVPFEQPLEIDVGSTETIAHWRSLMARLRSHAQVQLGRFVAAKQIQVEARLLKAADQDHSLVQRKLIDLLPLIQAGDYETLDDRLPTIEEELARSGLAMLLRRNELERTRLEINYANRLAQDAWLDDRLEKTLVEGTVDETLASILTNLLRLRVETLDVPSRLHWSAYEALCTRVQGDTGLFQAVGMPLWKGAWAAVLSGRATSDDLPGHAYPQVRQSLEAIAQQHPDAVALLVQQIAAGLVVVWGDGKRKLAQAIIARRQGDIVLQAALVEVAQLESRPRARRELLSAWLRGGDVAGVPHTPAIARGVVEALVEERCDAEAAYAMEAFRETHIPVGGEHGAVHLALLLRALEGAQVEIVTTLLTNPEIREAIAGLRAGKALLLLIAWQPRRFSESVAAMQHMVVISLDTARPALTPELFSLAHAPLAFELGEAHEIRDLVQSIKQEYQTNKFHGNWDSSRHFEADFHALVEQQLDGLLHSTGPQSAELAKQQALWDAEVWIDRSLRAQRERGRRTSDPDGPARRSIVSTFAEVRSRFIRLASLRPPAGQPSLAEILAAEQRIETQTRMLLDWLSADEDGSAIQRQLNDRVARFIKDSSGESAARKQRTSSSVYIGRFALEIALFEKSPLLFDVEEGARTDSQRYLKTLLAYCAGERGLAEAAQEYLERNDLVRAARCIQEMEVTPPGELCVKLEAAWEDFQRREEERLRRLQGAANSLRAENFQWDNALDFDNAVREVDAITAKFPRNSGETFRREFVRLDHDTIGKLNEHLELAEIAIDLGQQALREKQKERRADLLKTKRQIDEKLDELRLRPDLGPEYNHAIDVAQLRLVDCLRGWDLDGMRALFGVLQKLENNDVSSVLSELGNEEMPAAAFRTSVDRRPVVHAPQRLLLHELGSLARKTLGAAAQEKRNAVTAAVPEFESRAFSALVWNSNDLERQRDVVRKVIRTVPDGAEGDRALGEYLMSEGKLRLLDDKPLQAASFFIDAFRWTCTAAAEQVPAQRDTAASSLLVATLVAYLPSSERIERLDPKNLTTALQRGPLATLLPEMDRRGLLGGQVWVAAQMGQRDGTPYLAEYVFPYLDGHSRAAHTFIEQGIRDLAAALDDARLTGPLLALLALTLDRFVSELRAGASPAFQTMLEDAGKLRDSQQRPQLRDILLRFRGLVLPFIERYDIAAIAAERLEEEAERLGSSVGPAYTLSHSSLTPTIVLGEVARVILQLSLPSDAQLLRNVQTEVELVDSLGQPLANAVHAPAILARLGPKERREISLPFARLDLPREVMLRVRYQSLKLEGEARLIETRAKQFALTLEAPSRANEAKDSNPYLVGLPVQSPDRIYGREKEVDEIWSNLAGERQDNVVLVTGERRIGKSTLLIAVETHPGFRHRYLILKDDLQAFRHERSLAVLFRTRLLARIRSRLKDAGIELSPIPEEHFQESPGSAFEEFMRDVDRTLEAKDQRLLLILDELDQLLENETIGTQAIAVLRAVILACKRTSFLFAGATEILNRHTTTREDRFFRLAVEVKLKPLDVRPARRLVQEPVQRHYELTEFATDLILRETNRQPYLLQYVGSIVFQQMIDRMARTVTEIDVAEILSERVVPRAEVFHDFIASIVRADDFLVVKALAALQLGNRWVSVTDLRRELGRMDKTVSEDDLKEQLRKLTESAPLVVERRLTTHAYRLQVGLFARHLRFIAGDANPD